VVVTESSLLTAGDLHLFNEGTHLRLHEKLGAHPGEVGGRPGAHFAVWAPNARAVYVTGDWNEWSSDRDRLHSRESSGIWEAFVPGARAGQLYKYRVVTRDGRTLEKADPLAFHAETPPGTASRVWGLDYEWDDGAWMQSRGEGAGLSAPWSTYEVHLGSWRRTGPGPGVLSNYRDIASPLAEYVNSMGFTHVELLPLMEHPFYGSWGYQTTGYFAPTSRYGTPQDLMFLIDTLHQAGIGLILDWVPSHFPTDAHGLGVFDGTHLYEHGDPKEGFHPDWKSYIFNYGRHEVSSFLLSSAAFWLDCYHADALRVDAVASMLYRDYSRPAGEWVPNAYGGRDNLEAIGFLKHLNTEVYAQHADVQTIAEESTAWPGVSRPVSADGLGFGMKWDMGWMNDTLQYMRRDPAHRCYHQDEITFRAIYAFHENFVLPLSHDEVVHGKGSLLSQMPGDDWQKFANLRLLFGLMYTQPGKKLLFMGAELGQWAEWNHESEVEWNLLQHAPHRGLQRWVRDLNTAYRGEPALHELDCDPGGFEWIDTHDALHSTLAFLRRGASSSEAVLLALNFTPVPRPEHRLGVPFPGRWHEILNSDAELYGGSGQGNLGSVDAEPVGSHGRAHSIRVTLPPLGVVAFRGAPE